MHVTMLCTPLSIAFVSGALIHGAKSRELRICGSTSVATSTEKRHRLGLRAEATNVLATCLAAREPFQSDPARAGKEFGEDCKGKFSHSLRAEIPVTVRSLPPDKASQTSTEGWFPLARSRTAKKPPAESHLTSTTSTCMIISQTK